MLVDDCVMLIADADEAYATMVRFPSTYVNFRSTSPIPDRRAPQIEQTKYINLRTRVARADEQQRR